MQLSENTVQVLRNFASINKNIVFEPGKQITTVSEADTIICKAELDTEITNNFGIFNLDEFLNVISLVDEPRLRFEEHYVQIGDGAGITKINYYFSDPDHLKTFRKPIDMPDPEVKFDLSQETLSKVKRAASALGHKGLSVSNADGVIRLTVEEPDNVTSNKFSIDVPGKVEDNTDFNFHLAIEYLNKIIPGDYTVGINSIGVSHFACKQNPIQYWIAIDKKHSYYGA